MEHSSGFQMLPDLGGFSIFLSRDPNPFHAGPLDAGFSPLPPHPSRDPEVKGRFDQLLHAHCKLQHLLLPLATAALFHVVDAALGDYHAAAHVAMLAERGASTSISAQAHVVRDGVLACAPMKAAITFNWDPSTLTKESIAEMPTSKLIDLYTDFTHGTVGFGPPASKMDRRTLEKTVFELSRSGSGRPNGRVRRDAVGAARSGWLGHGPAPASAPPPARAPATPHAPVAMELHVDCTLLTVVLVDGDDRVLRVRDKSTGRLVLASKSVGEDGIEDNSYGGALAVFLPGHLLTCATGIDFDGAHTLRGRHSTGDLRLSHVLRVMPPLGAVASLQSVFGLADVPGSALPRTFDDAVRAFREGNLGRRETVEEERCVGMGAGFYLLSVKTGEGRGCFRGASYFPAHFHPPPPSQRR